jgi:hypothetical protein
LPYIDWSGNGLRIRDFPGFVIFRKAAMPSDAIDSDRRTRAARLEARVTTDQKAPLQRAATLSGRTVSFEFPLRFDDRGSLTELQATQRIGCTHQRNASPALESGWGRGAHP